MPTMMCTLPDAIWASSFLWSVAERFSCDEKSAMVHSESMRLSSSLFQCPHVPRRDPRADGRRCALYRHHCARPRGGALPTRAFKNQASQSGGERMQVCHSSHGGDGDDGVAGGDVAKQPYRGGWHRSRCCGRRAPSQERVRYRAQAASRRPPGTPARRGVPPPRPDSPPWPEP